MMLSVAPLRARARWRRAPHSYLAIHRLARELARMVAADLSEEWGGGEITPSVYESAWVAMVRQPDRPREVAFPATLEWLLRAQHRDGSWGARFPYSILPSMAALLALRKAPRKTWKIRSASARARRYLRRHIGQWPIETFDTPFFEFLAPKLANELAREGIKLPIPNLEVMRQRSAEKLARVPLDYLYSGRSNLIHAIEALGSEVDFTRLQGQQAQAGHYGYSPSSTAAVLLSAPAWDHKAMRWLAYLSSHQFGGAVGAMPTSHPADAFETAWVMYFLLLGDITIDPAATPALLASLDWLRCSLTVEGASFARTRALPCDADDTAVVLTVLNRYGAQTALDPLWTFEEDDHFVSYVGERTSSSSANAHALEAITSVDTLGDGEHAGRRDKIVRYLLRERRGEGYWLDKWHISPYYATLSCVQALARVLTGGARRALAPTLEWIIQAQRRDGGWGDGRSTLEETAYAAMSARTLFAVVPTADPTARDRYLRLMRRAQRFLQRRLGDLARSARLPTMWVDKDLYAPPRVICAAVLSALHACALSGADEAPYETGAR